MTTNNPIKERCFLFKKKLLFYFFLCITFGHAIHAQTTDFDAYKATLIADYEFTSETKNSYDPYITEHIALVNENGQFLDMMGTYQSTRIDSDGDSHVVTVNSENINFYEIANRNLKSAFIKKHITRVETMAAGYISQESIHYEDEQLFDKIKLALQFWKNNFFDFEFNNFYVNAIGLPTQYGRILTFMEQGKKQLSNSLVTIYIDKMAEIKQREDNGANSLDVLAHHMNRAALTEDESLASETIDEVYFIVRLANGTTDPFSEDFSDGIKADWSFQQHDAQMQTTTYGESYIESATEIFYFLNSSTQINASKLNVLTSFIHNGYANGFIGANKDWSVSGRHISTRESTTSQTSVTGNNPSVITLEPNKGPFDKMAIFDAANANNYVHFLERQQKIKTPFEGDGLKFGNSQFFRSDYMSHRVKLDPANSANEGYYASVRSKSKRVIGTENSNGQNILGWHLSSGTTYFMVNGNEYPNAIVPLMDWTKLPGVTAVSDDPLLFDCSALGSGQSWKCAIGETEFVGSVSNGTYGAAVHDYSDSRTGVLAKKSWFFLEDYIVCLGTGISANATGSLTTSVNQVLLDGDITVKIGETASQLLAQSTNHTFTDESSSKWIHHDSIGYYFPAQNKLTINNTNKTGKWSDVSVGNQNDNEVNDETFQLWINHGENENIANQSYSYIVAPTVTSASDMLPFDELPIGILENTSSIQAVMQSVPGNEILQIVFYEAGTFDNGNGIQITVDEPCILMLTNINDSEVSLHVSDPTQLQTSINVSVKVAGMSAAQSLECIMPTHEYRGSSASYSIENESSEEPEEPTVDPDPTDDEEPTDDTDPTDNEESAEDPDSSVLLAPMSDPYVEEIKDNILYPNPAKNSFFINNSDTIRIVEIRNVNGKLIRRINNPNQSDRLEIDTTNLPKAIYLVQMFDKNNNKVTKKIIKQ